MKGELVTATSTIELMRALEGEGIVTPQGLNLTNASEDVLSVDTCLALASYFGTVNELSRWMIGDLLRYVDGAYGEEVVAQIADATRLRPQTLANIESIARRVPLQRRRIGKLAFSTVAEVASLEPKEQTRYLDMAEKENLSRDELRGRIQRERGPQEIATAVCETCGKPL